MQLTQKAIEAINILKTRLLLAVELECSELTIKRLIENNDDRLTTAGALKVIRKETGLNNREILEDSVTEKCA